MFLRTSVLFLLLSMPVFAAALPAKCAQTTQKHVAVGMYVERLGEFSPSTKSFAADLWVWALFQPDGQFHPINTLRMQNARQVTQFDVRESDGWGYTEFNGQFQHEWNTRDFPFDRNQLDLAVGETQCDARYVVYTPDERNSGVARYASPDWKITGWKLTTPVLAYESNFGDSTARKPTHWTEAHLVIDVSRRHRFGLFLKATFTAYVAFVMAMLSFFMADKIFTARISILIGSLFATAVGMRANESILGQGSAFTMVDRIHIGVAGAILIITGLGLLSRCLRRRWLDGVSFVAVLLGFILYNAIVILAAWHGR